MRETLRRAKLDPAAIGSVVMGNVIQAGNRMNPARQAAIGGGVPVSVPAMTVNRVCGSGAQAIVTAAQQILTGEIDAADRRRHGEHGPRPVPDGRRTLGLPDGSGADPRQHAARRSRRCLLRQAFGLAHRRSRHTGAAQPRGAGPFCRPLATALQRGAKGGQVRGRNRCRGGARQDRAPAAFAVDEAPRA